MLRSLCTATAAFGLLFCSQLACAVGLGGIRVESSLNQTFSAHIPFVSLSPDEADSIRVRMARNQDFSRFSLEKTEIIASIEVGLKLDDGKPRIVLTSPDIVREPLLNLLLEVRTPGGPRIFRQFTVLLDPPGSRRPEPAPVAKPLTIPRPAAAPAAPAPTALVVVTPSTPAAPSDPVPQADSEPQIIVVEPERPVVVTRPVAEEEQAATPDSPPEPAPESEFYETEAEASSNAGSAGTIGPIGEGQTLWQVAEKVRPSGVTNSQAMLALFEANPKAFADGNIDRLYKGATLVVPEKGVMTSLASVEAFRKIKALRARGDLAEVDQASASSPPDEKLREDPPDEIAEADTAPDNAALDDEDEISGSEAAEISGGAEIEQPDAAVDEGALVEAESAELASHGAADESSSPDSESDSEIAPDAFLEEGADSTADEFADAVPDQANPESANPEKAIPAESEPEPSAVSNAELAGSVPTESTINLPESGQGSAGDSDSPLDGILSQAQGGVAKFYVPILAGLAALLGLVGAIRFFRNRKAKSSDHNESSFAPVVAPSVVPVVESSADVELKDDQDDLDLTITEATARQELEEIERALADEEEADRTVIMGAADPSATVGQSDEDEDATIRFDPSKVASTEAESPAEMDVTTRMQASTKQIDLEGDDPISEAEFHLAYGLYDEAATLLQSASEKDPDRADIKVKLAETYFAAGKTDEFESIAQGLKEDIGAEEWSKISIMGRQLLPDSAIFAETGDLQADVGLDMSLDAEPETALPEIEAPLDSDPIEEAPASSEGGEAEITEPPPELAKDSNVLEFPELTEDEIASVLPDANSPETEAGDAGENQSSSSDDDSLDFNLDDFDIGDESTDSSEPEVDRGEGLEFDLGEFNIGESEAATGIDAPIGDAEDLNLDDFDLGESSSASELELPEVEDALELGDDEDLTVRVSEDDDDPTVLTLPTVEDDDPEPTQDEEAGTKLDLARAYVEMGDKEMAKSLLEEVESSGTEEQLREAAELRNKMID